MAFYNELERTLVNDDICEKHKYMIGCSLV